MAGEGFVQLYGLEALVAATHRAGVAGWGLPTRWFVPNPFLRACAR